MLVQQDLGGNLTLLRTTIFEYSSEGLGVGSTETAIGLANTSNREGSRVPVVCGLIL